VIILTQNEEVNLPPCLNSLKGLDSPIVVVDSGSTDRTLEIAERYGAIVLRHEFIHYSAQRNWAQDHLPVETEWVLHLDADERLTPELVHEISETLRKPLGDLAGFMLRKRTIFMGRWIKHGGHYPSYHLRLFRKKLGYCEERLYDQHFLVEGRVAALKHDYLDVLASDLASWTTRHARWAALEAQDRLTVQDRREVRPALRGNPIERKRWLKTSVYERAPLFIRPLLYWLYRYIVRGGFRDGREGLIFHFLQGFWFRFLIDAICFEKEKVSGKKV
jgi:glycosyltransferase involved in cell wall biosynthesis